MNKLMIIPTSSINTDLFSCILMAIFYSSKSHNVILNKMDIKPNGIYNLFDKLQNGYPALLYQNGIS